MSSYVNITVLPVFVGRSANRVVLIFSIVEKKAKRSH